MAITGASISTTTTTIAIPMTHLRIIAGLSFLGLIKQNKLERAGLHPKERRAEVPISRTLDKRPHERAWRGYSASHPGMGHSEYGTFGRIAPPYTLLPGVAASILERQRAR